MENIDQIDHLAEAFANDLITFEDVITELIGNIEESEWVFRAQDYNFDIYTVMPDEFYKKNFTLLPRALDEFKKLSRTEALFQVLRHKNYAIIYVSHECTL